MSITTETRRESHEMVMPHKLRRRQEILEILAVHGPMTAEDVTEHLVFDGKIPAFDQNAARPRLTELKQLGRVEVVGKRESRRSGRKTALWAIKEAAVPEATGNDCKTNYQHQHFTPSGGKSQ